jgi:hypothetical protein
MGDTCVNWCWIVYSEVSNMKDAIVSCFNGFNASLPEWYAKGYGKYLKFASGTVVGLKPECNPMLIPVNLEVTDKNDPSYVDPYDLPALVMLRLPNDLMDSLLAEDWVDCHIISACEVGGEQVNVGTEEDPEYVTETLYSRLNADPIALARYLTYPEVQVPEFNADGTKNIQYAEFLTVDIDGVLTQVKNSHYQPFLGLGHYL